MSAKRKPAKSRPDAGKYYKRRVGLTALQQRQLQVRLRVFTPSEPWVEAQFKRVIDLDENDRPIVYCYHDPHVFPPGGKKTAMVRCPTCQVFTPPHAFEGGQCLDHSSHEGWGPSPSAVAIATLRHYVLRVEGLADLEPEDDDSLRLEIERYNRTGRVRAKRF
jgi:hypothetical protein